MMSADQTSTSGLPRSRLEPQRSSRFNNNTSVKLEKSILVGGCPKLVDAHVRWHNPTMPKSKPDLF